MSAETIIARIKKMRSLAEPDSPKLKTALHRIGSVLQAEIRLNIGRKHIVDFGGLLNSIKYQVDGNKLEVGSYGIKYAAMNEFGGKMSKRQVRAMFAAMNRRRGVHPRRGKPSKGIVKINPDGTGEWKPRPYIRPALQKHKRWVIQVLRDVGASK